MLANLEELTEENCLDALRKEVELRDKMGGALYWYVVNDDCQRIANQCIFKFNKGFNTVQAILENKEQVEVG